MSEARDFHLTSTSNIVIVDDTPANLHLLSGILKEQGYLVRGFPDGEFALKSVASAPPDLILLDVIMPNLDGYEVCEHLKADPATRDIPVIFISAMSDIRDKVRGFACGGVDYITKPFRSEEVLARVQTQLNLRRLQMTQQNQNRRLKEEVARRTQAEAELRALNTRLKDANRRQEITNEELRLVNQELHESNMTKDTFFSIIAHDLRSPFTGLIGLTELLLNDFESQSPEKLKDYLLSIHKSAKHTYRLLSNLLDWSRLQRGLMECRCERQVVESIVHQIVTLFTLKAHQKGVHLLSSCSSDLEVYADTKMLHTILRNLISNALKFSKSGDQVAISGELRPDGWVDIAVKDSGIGMPPDYLEKLFDIDARSSRSGTRKEQGTGLGLVLCRELVRQHGGRISVESEVGIGSRFTVSFPPPAVSYR